MRCFPLKKWLCLFLLLSGFASQSFAQNVSVTATVDKNSLTLEDVLQLSIVIQGTQNTPPPELPPLPDFKVTSAGTSTSVQYINTQRSVSITHNYRLTPMNTGTFIIGPTRVRANGKTYSTRPITIAVKKSANSTGNKTAFVVTTLSSKKAYIGEQLVYTFRLFHRVDAKNLNLNLPFDKTLFHKEELGEPKSYSQVINGLQYHVQELSLALFPLKKGHYEIPASTIDLDLLYPVTTRSSRDPFGQFFGRRTRAEHKVLRAQPLPIEVHPLPAGAPQGFEDIIGQFNISAKLGKNNLEVGDTTTLTVTVSGKGNVQDVRFAEPDLLKGTFKIYPDKPEFHQTVQNNQFAGEKVFKFALVPLQAGTRTLPKFSLVFFDPEKAQYRVAQTTAISLNIKSAEIKEELNLVQPHGTPEIKIIGRDIFPIYTELDKFQNTGSPSSVFLATSLGSPVLLFIISAFLIKRQKRMKYDVAFYRSRNAYNDATQRIKKMSEYSANAKEFGRELSEILREYVGNKLNLQGKATTAEEVEVRLKEANYESAEATRKLLEKCETLQYAPLSQGSTKEMLSQSENLIKLLEKQS